MATRRTNGGNNGDVRKNGSQPVTRAEFDKLVELVERRGDMIDELRRELQSTCRDLAEGVRRELQTQFTRMVQIQQEVDGLKRNSGG